MRAGAFSEKRVIDLVNRRFVPFYFNTGGPGEGHDDGAAAFVKGKVRNRWAFLAVFKPDGTYLGETDVYADKNDVFDFLRERLLENPEFARSTVAEQQVLEAAAALDADARRLEAAGSLLEELGEYDAATARYKAAIAMGPRSEEAFRAGAGLVRIPRYSRQWGLHATRLEAWIAAMPAAHADASTIDVIAERGFALIAKRRFAEARQLLEPATRRAAGHPRVAELHVYAGVACWMSGDRDWAKFHWCWVVKNRPDDRLYMRAYIAAAAEAMPYPNPELDDYAAPVGNIGTDAIVRGVARSMAIYESLRPRFEAGDFGPASDSRPTSRPDSRPPSSDARALARRLKDGNEFRVANNEVLENLVKLGAPSIDALIEVVNDEQSEGRGYASFGLAHVMKALGLKDERALSAMRACLDASDPYVVVLTGSGLRLLGESPAKSR